MRAARTRALTAAVVLCFSSLCFSNTGLANSAAIRVPPPTTATSPQLPTATSLRVTHEDLSFDCDEEHLVVRCRFEARYQVDNPTTQQEVAVAAFYGIGTSDIVVRVDGGPAHRPLTRAEEELLDARVRDALADPDALPREVTRTGFQVSLAPGAKTEVVVQGVMTEKADDPADRYYNRAWALDAVDTRHPILRTTHEGRSWKFRYLLAPLRTWSGAPSIKVRVRSPRGLAHFGGPGAEGEPRFEDHVEEGREVVTGTFDADAWPGSLEFGFWAAPPELRNGGALLGFGTVDGKFRLRLGYEIAAPRWLLYSANLDFDFRGKFIAAPVVKAATPWLAIIPSLGIGLGLPVQLRPDVRAGVRLQFDASLSSLGFLVSIDHYPKTATLPEVTETAFMFQLGL